MSLNTGSCSSRLWHVQLHSNEQLPTGSTVSTSCHWAAVGFSDKVIAHVVLTNSMKVGTNFICSIAMNQHEDV